MKKVLILITILTLNALKSTAHDYNILTSLPYLNLIDSSGLYSVSNEMLFPQFSLSRDLHCWTMQFSWSPAIEVYSFFIGVKSSSLSFLKYDYGQRNSGRLT